MKKSARCTKSTLSEKIAEFIKKNRRIQNKFIQNKLALKVISRAYSPKLSNSPRHSPPPLSNSPRHSPPPLSNSPLNSTPPLTYEQETILLGGSMASGAKGGE